MFIDKYEHIGWEIREGIGILTLSSPPENRLSEPEFIPLDTFRHLAADPELKGILVEGKGRHFSSGADLENLFELASEPTRLAAHMASGNRLISFMATLDIPVVAAIQGACFGGGLEITLACHIRLCAPNALFAFPESTHNLMPGLGGTYRLPRIAGHAASLEMILKGDIVNAEEALSMGLADRILPKEDLHGHAFGLLKKMTLGKPLPVIHAVIRALRNASTMGPEEAIREETRLFCDLAVTEAIRRVEEERDTRS